LNSIQETGHWKNRIIIAGFPVYYITIRTFIIDLADSLIYRKKRSDFTGSLHVFHPLR
jgi:hypothetical protein